jgi:hypothetical protein
MGHFEGDSENETAPVWGSGRQEGALVARLDNIPRKNVSPGNIARSAGKFENAAVFIAGSHFGMNRWQ